MQEDICTYGRRFSLSKGGDNMVTYSELIQFVIMLTEVITLYFLSSKIKSKAFLFNIK